MPNPLTNLPSRLLGARLHLGITQHSVALTRSSTAWSTKFQCIGINSYESQELPTACAPLLTQPSCANLPLVITLGHALGQLFMVTPPASATQQSVLAAAAAMRFESLFGKDSKQWHIDADWQANRPFLACAYPKALIATLLQTAQLGQNPILSIRPYFVSMWNYWQHELNSNSWFGVIENNVLVLGLTSPNSSAQLVGIRSVVIPEDGELRHWLEEQLQRTALQYHVAVPAHLQLMGNSRYDWQQDKNSKALHITHLAATPSMIVSMNGHGDEAQLLVNMGVA